MNRYKNTEVVNNKFSQTLYPKIEKRETDIYVAAKDGDRLDLLAYKYYKDPSLWWIIARANNLSGDSVFIDIPKRLRIPQDVNFIINNINVR